MHYLVSFPQLCLGFKHKYKVDSIEDILGIISKLKDRNVEDKFSKFVTYFKKSMKPRKSSGSKKSLDMSGFNEKEMLDEIASFVSSKDFNKFYKKCKIVYRNICSIKT